MSRRPSTPTVDSRSGPITGLEAVSARVGEHGIAAEHLRRLAEFADRHNVVFAIRQVNPAATPLILQGYPTKWLNIKGKSAEVGPHAGLIPVRQEFSKLGGRSSEEIAAANQKVQANLASGEVVAVPLELSAQRLRELLDSGRVSRVSGAIGFSDQLTIHSRRPGPDAALHEDEFTAVREHRAAPYRILHQGRPFEVVGRTEAAADGPGGDRHPDQAGPSAGASVRARPVTADYDLLMFAAPLALYGPSDRTPLASPASPVDAPADNALFSPGALTAALGSAAAGAREPAQLGAGLSPAAAGTPRHAGKGKEKAASLAPPSPARAASPVSWPGHASPAGARGVISQRLAFMLEGMNRAVGRTPDNPLFHHGPETFNPHAVTSDAAPAVFFFPASVEEAGSVLFAATLDDVHTALQIAKDAQYQFFGNPRWDGKLTPRGFTRGSFTAAVHIWQSRQRVRESDVPPILGSPYSGELARRRMLQAVADLERSGPAVGASGEETGNVTSVRDAQAMRRQEFDLLGVGNVAQPRSEAESSMLHHPPEQLELSDDDT